MDNFNQQPVLRCFVDWQGMGREGRRAIKWATGVHHEMLPGHVMSSAVRASSEQIASKADRSHEGGREGGAEFESNGYPSYLSERTNVRVNIRIYNKIGSKSHPSARGSRERETVGCRCILGPKLLLAVGCEKLGN